MNDEKKYTLKELEDKLTQKEKAFCHEYIIDWNGTRAAIAAGYSQNSARNIAYENKTKPHIAQYIDYIKEDIAKEAGISKLSLINELKLIAFSNMPAAIEKYKELGIEGLSEAEQKSIIEIIHDGEYLKIRGFDKRGAIQDIMKAMGWNEPSKVEVNNLGESKTINISIDGNDIDLGT